jgi:predicted MFS family arabinose efflux permease
MVVGAAVLAVFSCQQSRKEATGQIPLIPFKLFRYRGYTIGVILNIMLYLAIIPFFFVLGLYLQNVCRLSSWSAGLTFLPIGIGFIIGSTMGSEMIRKMTSQRTLILGTACTTAGLSAALICVIGGPPVVTPFVLGSLLIFGFGNGTTLPIVTGVVMRYLPVNEAGAGAAVLTTGQQLFGAIGVAMTGMIVLIGSHPPTFAGAYAGGLAAQVLSALAALLCAFLLMRIGKER